MKKRVITIDIETLPVGEAFEEKLFWETEKEYLDTALDAALGRILCIGYSEFDENGKFISAGCFGWRADEKNFEPDESAILAEFWEFMRGFNVKRDVLIGHNILSFDLPFIVRRSIAKRVAPTVEFSFYKYQKAPIYDTMLRWDFWIYRREGSVSLAKIAYALGLDNPKSGGIDGSKIYEAFTDGRFEEIYRYCMRDVETTRKVWRRISEAYIPQKRQSIALAV